MVQVNLKLFTPAPNRRRTVLLFVFRDMTKTPLQQLKATWEEDLQRMWASITKPPHYDAYSFSDFFEVTSLDGAGPICSKSVLANCKTFQNCMLNAQIGKTKESKEADIVQRTGKIVDVPTRSFLVHVA